MRINKIYLDKFKKTNNDYMFMIKRGVFIIFDKDTLEYKGIFSIHPYYKYKDIEESINKLVALDYLEV